RRTASTASSAAPTTSCRPSRVADLTVLVAARDEEGSIGRTVAALRAGFPDADVLVADDGSRDRTAPVAEEAGARVIRLPRLGKGQALALAEREAGPGTLLLCDADLEGDPAPLVEADADLAVAAFRELQGGGFGIAKRAARALIRACSGFEAREPLSGQRAVSPAARAACFPTAPGFGCEVRMTIDAVRAGLEVAELALLGLVDDLRSGPERGLRGHLGSGRTTTGVLKAVGIPALALAATRTLSGATLVSLSANTLNLLDTRPGRALKAFFAVSAL